MHWEGDNSWTAEKNADLHGQSYHYRALFGNETNWNHAPKILDPDAKAICSGNGPGVILNERTFLPLRNNFISHPMRDDVILEVPVRNLLKNARYPSGLSKDYSAMAYRSGYEKNIAISVTWAPIRSNFNRLLNPMPQTKPNIIGVTCR
jgi:hypothetical protein